MGRIQWMPVSVNPQQYYGLMIYCPAQISCRVKKDLNDFKQCSACLLLGRSVSPNVAFVVFLTPRMCTDVRMKGLPFYIVLPVLFFCFVLFCFFLISATTEQLIPPTSIFPQSWAHSLFREALINVLHLLSTHRLGRRLISKAHSCTCTPVTWLTTAKS